MAFISKNWQKRATDNAVNALMRAGGAGAAAFILKKTTEDESTPLKKTLKNISSPLLTAISVLGDLMLEDEKLRSLCQGMYTFGILKTVSTIAPAVQESLGLAGVDVNGIMNGIQFSNSNTTSALPPEIIEAQATAEPQGKVFEQVAEYIEQGADDAVTVQGIAENMLINN